MSEPIVVSEDLLKAFSLLARNATVLTSALHHALSGTHTAADRLIIENTITTCEEASVAIRKIYWRDNNEAG